MVLLVIAVIVSLIFSALALVNSLEQKEEARGCLTIQDIEARFDRQDKAWRNVLAQLRKDWNHRFQEDKTKPKKKVAKKVTKKKGKKK